MRKLSAVLAIGLAGAIATPAQAAVLTWATNLSAAQEIGTGSNSTATGFGMVQFDDSTNVLTLNLQWQGLTGGPTAAHIHCCVGSPPNNVGVALGLFGGGSGLGATDTFNAVYDLDLVNPFSGTFSAGTALQKMNVLIGAMNAGGGRAYYNIHTAQFPGGEIRGNLTVPEPATLSLLIGALGLLVAGRKFARS